MQYMDNHGMLLEAHGEDMHPKPHTKLYPILVPSKTSLNGDIPVTPIGRDGRRDDVGFDPDWSKKESKLYWVRRLLPSPFRWADVISAASPPV
jgi:beta-1,2-xylosyltransferase